MKSSRSPLVFAAGLTLLAIPFTTSAAAQGPVLTSNGQALPAAPVSPPTFGAASSPLYYSEDSTGTLWTIDPVTAVPTPIGVSGVVGSTVGLSPRDATTLYGTIWFDTHIIQADGTNSAFFGDAGAEGLAYDGVTDTLYGAINGAFFEIDTTTGSTGATLAAPGGDVEGIAFGNGGVYGLVGFAGTDPNLYFYDPGTNSWSTVGDTGIDWNLVGLAYDPAADILYAKGSQDDGLYRIDPATGNTTLIGSTGLFNGGGLAWLGSFGDLIGSNYCGPAQLNSSGQSAIISAFGLTSAVANNVRLDAAQMATNQFGMFLNSMTPGFVNPPGSQGNLCLSGGIGRYNSSIMNTGPTGEFSLQLDLTQTPTPGGPVSIQAGETWFFQAWFRDQNPGNTSNFTDGLTITFS